MKSISIEEREQRIRKDLHKKLHWLTENTNHDVIYLALQGSQNYGLDVYTSHYKSDIDAKAMILPSLDDVISGQKLVSKTYVMDDGSQVEVKDVRLFLDLWRKANPTYLEILFTNYHIVINEEFRSLLLDMKECIPALNKESFLKSVKGIAYEKWKSLYKIPPNSTNTNGYQPKHLHHMVRMQMLVEDMFINHYSFEEAITLRTNIEKRKRLLYYKIEPIDIVEVQKLAHNTIDTLDSQIHRLLLENTYTLDEQLYHLLSCNIKQLVKNKMRRELKV